MTATAEVAHRKPIGTTCSAHFRRHEWPTMPDLGDYLVSTAGTAYLVVGLAEGRSRVRYTLERAALVPHDAPAVYEFFWLDRGPRQPARRSPTRG